MPSSDLVASEKSARIIAYGDRALLVELGSSAAVASYAQALRAAAVPGVVELVPAARTVLVRYAPSVRSVDALRRDLEAIEHAPTDQTAAADTEVVVIEVHYDGEDLAAVATLCDTTIGDVIRRHEAATYRSAFCGFAPGFAYLTGIDQGLRVPRLDTPRPRVAAGSVAIAGEFAGVYPNDMPGGWRILGHTDAVLWDLAREQPALLAPGTAVRFRSVDR